MQPLTAYSLQVLVCFIPGFKHLDEAMRQYHDAQHPEPLTEGLQIVQRAAQVCSPIAWVLGAHCAQHDRVELASSR